MPSMLVVNRDLTELERQKIKIFYLDFQDWLLEYYPNQIEDEKFKCLTLIAFYAGYEAGFCDEWVEDNRKPVQRVALKAFAAGTSVGATRAALWVKE